MDEEEVGVITGHHEVVAVVAPPEVLMGDVAISVEVADATKPEGTETGRRRCCSRCGDRGAQVATQ
jgi:hypothetical protein